MQKYVREMYAEHHLRLRLLINIFIAEKNTNSIVKFHHTTSVCIFRGASTFFSDFSVRSSFSEILLKLFCGFDNTENPYISKTNILLVGTGKERKMRIYSVLIERILR